MSDFKIDLDWPIAKYEYRPAAPWDYSSYVDDLMKPIVFPSGKILEQGRSRKEAEALVPDPPLGHLVRKGPAKMARPAPKAMEYAVRLLVERKDVPLHKVALTIARTIGGLTLDDKEELEHWDKLANYLRGIFKGDHEEFDYVDAEVLGVEVDPNSPPLIGSVGIFLDRDRGGNLKLALRPEDLTNALILYAARMATTGTTFNTCEHCNSPFLSGGMGRSKKRADARFCTAACRWRHHNEERRKAKSKS
jgi:hypothetical protein